MKIFRGYFGRSIIALTVLTALSSTLFGQKQLAAEPFSKTSKNIANILASPNAMVDPVVLGNNPNCEDLNALHVSGTGTLVSRISYRIGK